jgi:single-strand DNA-binding protein
MIRNKVILIGRLTRDIELKKTQSDVSCVSFSLAVDKPYKKDREHPEATFVNCTACRGQAEFLVKYFAKRDKVAIEGYLDDNVWTDKEGKERRDKIVVVNEVEFVEKKANKQTSDSPATNEAATNVDDDSDESLPF